MQLFSTVKFVSLFSGLPPRLALPATEDLELLHSWYAHLRSVEAYVLSRSVSAPSSEHCNMDPNAQRPDAQCSLALGGALAEF